MKRARLVEARQRKNWTLEDAAAHLSVDPHTLWRWEDGRVTPRAHSRVQLCAVYGISAQELGLECEAHQDPQGSLVTTTMGTAMTDEIKSSIQQDLTIHLMSIVCSWRSGDRYEDLQTQINKAVEGYNAVIEHDVDHVVTRRNALRSMVLWPIQMCGLAALGQATRQPTKDILAQCTAGVTACWYFGKGKEFALTNDALDIYIPALNSIVRLAAEQDRKDAAALLIQCYLLKAKLAWHLNGHEQSMRYLKAADGYGELANSATLSILTARIIAATYGLASRQDLALLYAEKARALCTRTTLPHLQSFVYAGLATYQAQHGKKQDALSSLGMAHKMFDRNNSAVWVGHSFSNLLLNDGETHYHLGMQKAAIEVFSRIPLLAEEDRTEAGKITAYTDQAMAEINRSDQPRDMENSIALLTRGIEGSKQLRSEQRFTDARTVYAMLCAVWPGEQRIKALRDQLVHW